MLDIPPLEQAPRQKIHDVVPRQLLQLLAEEPPRNKLGTLPLLAVHHERPQLGPLPRLEHRCGPQRQLQRVQRVQPPPMQAQYDVEYALDHGPHLHGRRAASHGTGRPHAPPTVIRHEATVEHGRGEREAKFPPQDEEYVDVGERDGELDAREEHSRGGERTDGVLFHGEVVRRDLGRASSGDVLGDPGGWGRLLGGGIAVAASQHGRGSSHDRCCHRHC
mmetsp:Transcript_12351/g.30206  ORF Transcript_12351/g.30206 Transcript_12351/m.30206 type:complete len:220 (+) Transcript_12351:2161-2820(+)